ncbi:hypothetical protein GGTG_00182 [Gaeumannomyces tritici R3-111a-1]|uniref:Uncharacterized protein n=1 Tax=Gaeumannomyces tritici (strain R3-111a-1) TaxID=644352 RepID=J3NFY9_GAET3|nr:hypothetical protein GGTG_00182 [Gaeumannomyces tritici R3-111a-1]EJT80179.1 hypothetical protein GGTG_00182 [Gaeumannomyces tritici R3-111a-1]
MAKSNRRGIQTGSDRDMKASDIHLDDIACVCGWVRRSSFGAGLFCQFYPYCQHYRFGQSALVSFPKGVGRAGPSALCFFGDTTATSAASKGRLPGWKNSVQLAAMASVTPDACSARETGNQQCHPPGSPMPRQAKSGSWNAFPKSKSEGS